MNEIDAIIYFDDLADLERFNPEDWTISDHSETTKRVKNTYFTREQWTTLDINAVEIRHILRLIKDCRDFYRYPSAKFRSFPKFIRRYGVYLKQIDIENVLRSLWLEVLCKCCCSTDGESWRRTFLKFEIYNNGYKLSPRMEFSTFGLPIIVYIVITEDIRASKRIALVSFTSYEFELSMLGRYTDRRVNLNYIEKIGSVYILSVVAKPYSAEDPFFKFYISEDSYNEIMRYIDGLSKQDQIKYHLQRKHDAYKTHVVYRSMDPVNHGLPIAGIFLLE